MREDAENEYEYLWPCFLHSIERKIDDVRRDMAKNFYKQLHEKVGSYIEREKEHSKAMKMLLKQAKKREEITLQYFESNPTPICKNKVYSGV